MGRGWLFLLPDGCSWLLFRVRRLPHECSRTLFRLRRLPVLSSNGRGFLRLLPDGCSWLLSRARRLPHGWSWTCFRLCRLPVLCAKTFHLVLQFLGNPGSRRLRRHRLLLLLCGAARERHGRDHLLVCFHVCRLHGLRIGRALCLTQ